MAIDMKTLLDDIHDDVEKDEKDEYAALRKRISGILRRVGTRLDRNPDDSDIELVEILLGIKPGGLDELRTKLGFTAPTEPSGPAALPVGGDSSPTFGRVIPALNEDGTPAGTGFLSMDDARAAGYTVLHMEGGEAKGVKRPSTPATPTVPTPAVDKNDPTREVPSYATNPAGMITIAAGDANPKLRRLLDASGTVVGYRPKGLNERKEVNPSK